MSGFDIDGLDEAQAAFREAAQKVRPEIRKSVYRGGMNVKREAKSRAPRKVFAAGSIEVTVTDDGDGIRADIETKSPLGAVLEFGSPSLPGGRPFLGPSLEVEEEALPRAIDDIVDRLLP